MLLEYLIASAIGFAGMLGILQFAAEITTLHQHIIQTHAAAAVLREWSALAHMMGDAHAALDFCSGPLRPQLADTCQTLADRLKHLFDHRVEITSGGVFRLTWRDTHGHQLSAQLASTLH